MHNDLKNIFLSYCVGCGNPYICNREQKGISSVSAEETYLRAILATVARQAFPPERLAELVASNAGGEKQIAAYNLCDGEHTQSEIASAVGLDRGNLSRSI